MANRIIVSSEGTMVLALMYLPTCIAHAKGEPNGTFEGIYCFVRHVNSKGCF